METQERWKKIEGWSYSVSDLGRVRSDRTGKILTPLNKSGGYLGVYLHENNNRKNVLIHRAVLEAFKGNPDGKPFCNHIDGNKKNNNIENLEWSTPRENVRHAIKTGLRDKRPYSSILKEEYIPIIFRMKELGYKQRAIAEIFGVKRSAIANVLSRITWKDVSGVE